MRFLIVYAHPDRERSHNSAVLRLVKSWMDGRAADYSVIDLYGDGFDPAMPREEWADHTRIDSQVVGYQRAIREADRLVFIYPVWWYASPAMMKGFFDRVFTQDFAFNFKKEPGWLKLLKALSGPFLSTRILYPLISRLLPLSVIQRMRGKKALVINTFGGDASGYLLYGRGPQYSADRAVLEFCGIRPVRRVNWFDTRHTKGEMPGPMRSKMASELERLAR
ncbi:MAG: NAD(P)H-dependent oxidoreductase [Candidatus Micrarchaeota archaeon]